MDIQLTLDQIKNGMNLPSGNGIILIHGNEEQARKIYNILRTIGCLDGLTHSLEGDDDKRPKTHDVLFRYSTHHIDDDVETCIGAYIILPRTLDNYNRVIGQFFNTIPLPNVLHPTGREVYALDYTTKTSKIFLL